jgi:hypothetical protein
VKKIQRFVSNREVLKLKTENAELHKKVEELEAELDKHRCPICGRLCCQSDHGYDGGGPDWG